ncbi:MAG: hypothetical protein V1743_00255 [Nanoarchaeota archaeon]
METESQEQVNVEDDCKMSDEELKAYAAANYHPEEKQLPSNEDLDNEIIHEPKMCPEDIEAKEKEISKISRAMVEDYHLIDFLEIPGSPYNTRNPKVHAKSRVQVELSPSEKMWLTIQGYIPGLGIQEAYDLKLRRRYKHILGENLEDLVVDNYFNTIVDEVSTYKDVVAGLQSEMTDVQKKLSESKSDFDYLVAKNDFLLKKRAELDGKIIRAKEHFNRAAQSSDPELKVYSPAIKNEISKLEGMMSKVGIQYQDMAINLDVTEKNISMYEKINDDLTKMYQVVAQKNVEEKSRVELLRKIVNSNRLANRVYSNNYSRQINAKPLLSFITGQNEIVEKRREIWQSQEVQRSSEIDDFLKKNSALNGGDYSQSPTKNFDDTRKKVEKVISRRNALESQPYKN